MSHAPGTEDSTPTPVPARGRRPGRSLSPDSRLGTAAGAALAVAAVCWLSWLLQPLLAPDLPMHSSFVNELLADTEPRHRVFRFLVLAVGLCSLLAAALLPRRTWRRAGVEPGAALVLTLSLIGFGAQNIVTAVTPLPCRPSIDPGCRRRLEELSESSLAAPLHVGLGLLGLVAVLGALAAGWWLTSGSRSRRRSLLRMVAIPAGLLAFGSLLVPHSAEGLLQRLGLGLAALALLLVASLLVSLPRDVRRVGAVGRPAWQNRFASALSGTVLLAAGWSLLAVPLERITPRLVLAVENAFLAVNIGAGRSLFTAALLVVAGIALQSRKRVMWWVLLVNELMAVVIAAASLGALTYSAAVPHRSQVLLFSCQLLFGTAIAVALLLSRSAFPARLAPGSTPRALGILVVGLLASVAIAVLIAALLLQRLDLSVLQWALRTTIDLDPGGPAGMTDLAAATIRFVVGLIAGGTVVAAAAIFVRSAATAREPDADAELFVRRALLVAESPDSLGYFATRRDVNVFIDSERRGAIVYRVRAGTCLASGDPIGEHAAWPRLIEEWRDYAHNFGWLPGALSCSESGARAYTKAGMRALHLGDEAVVEVAGFDLYAPESAGLRHSVARLRGQGFTVTVSRQAEVGPQRLAELVELGQRWRAGDDGEAERGFTMALGRFADPADDRMVVVVAADPDGREHGLLTFVPWGTHGLSLDLMLRAPDAANGVTELMITSLIDAAGDLGIRRISLNFAVFRQALEAGDRVGAGTGARLTRSLVLFASRFWQLDSLYRANQRYSPTWAPRFICYDASPDLTRIATAAAIAEGHLPLGWLGRLGGASTSGTPRPPGFADQVREQEQELLTPVIATRRYSDQEQLRRDLREQIADPYPVSVPRDHAIAEVLAAHVGLPADARTGQTVSVAGRVLSVRDLGGALFAVLSDDGHRLQVLVTAGDSPAEQVARWRREVGRGDHVSVTGEVVTSRTGELSVLLHRWQLAAKCLHPLPRVISDPQAKVRQRYLDMAIDPVVAQQVRARSAAVRALREAFDERGYLEVETPMLQAIHGGANARPFVTRINAYSTDLYLRIAPELFLKRLCVGGLGAIFELNRSFRNEGADATHNPEFTSVEAYQAYGDYNSMRVLARDLVLAAAIAVHGEPVAVRPDGSRVDLSGPWPVIDVHSAISAAIGRTITPDTSTAELAEICAAHRVPARVGAGAGELVTELYDELVEARTEFPTFYTDFPVETSPLTRQHRGDPRLAERWDLVAFGAEIGTAYSELVDPVEQRRRLTEQSLKAAAGDPEAMELDEDFLTALEYSMPPTGGLGMGVDRIVMMLTGVNIRATIAFPFVKPQR